MSRNKGVAPALQHKYLSHSFQLMTSYEGAVLVLPNYSLCEIFVVIRLLRSTCTWANENGAPGAGPD